MLIMQEITSHVKKKELVIIYSLSGKTPELLKAADEAVARADGILARDAGDMHAIRLPIGHGERAVRTERDAGKGNTRVSERARLALHVALARDRAARQGLDLVLVRLDEIWFGRQRLFERFAARVEEERNPMRMGLLDQFAVDGLRHALRDAAGGHDDIGIREELRVTRAEIRELRRRDRRTWLEDLRLRAVVCEMLNAGTA